MSRGRRRSPEFRAGRLLRWYPRDWRRRYGVEFAALLEAEIAERPRCPRRTVDVALGGVFARVAAVGLAPNSLLDELADLRAGLGALGCCAVAFLVCAIALWAQLTIGWQWSEPSDGAVRIAMTVMTVLLPVLLALGVAAAAPVMAAAVRALRRGRGRGVRFPLALVTCGAIVLVAGSVTLDHGWPGTGGRDWAGKTLMPGGPASVLWAATVSLSSYWAHPARLGAFPAIEIAWMLLAPIATGCFAFGATRAIRRLELSTRILRFERLLALIAARVMVVVVAGAGLWVLGGDGGPRRLFATGAINTLELTVMALTGGAAVSIARRGAALSA